MAEQPAPASRPNGFRRAGSALRHPRNTELGQSLVEFSLVLPIFLVLIFGLVDFGRAFYAWLIVTEAAREGARAAAVQGDLNSVNSKIYASFCSGAGNPPPASTCAIDDGAGVFKITPGNIQGPRGQETTIDITYTFSFVTPIGGLLQLIGGSSLSAPAITAHSAMRLE